MQGDTNNTGLFNNITIDSIVDPSNNEKINKRIEKYYHIFKYIIAKKVKNGRRK